MGQRKGNWLGADLAGGVVGAGALRRVRRMKTSAPEAGGWHGVHPRLMEHNVISSQAADDVRLFCDSRDGSFDLGCSGSFQKTPGVVSLCVFLDPYLFIMNMWSPS